MPNMTSKSVMINRDGRDVWDYAVANDGWRHPYVVEVQKRDIGAVRVGTMFEETTKTLVIRSTTVREITEYEPPRLMSWTHPEPTPPIAVLNGSYILEPKGDATRFTITVLYDVIGAWKMASLFVIWQLEQRAFPRMLANLKRELEARGWQGGSGGASQ